MASVNQFEYRQLVEHTKSYREIRQWRDEHIQKVWDDSKKLNECHDMVMKATVQKAIGKIESEYGPAPAHFTFFLTGSGGRSEQLIWSDQDHGLIFAGEEVAQPYFLQLGKEISSGLNIVGYKFCDGNVMASNPKWCHSVEEWKKQICDWLSMASFETLRYFTTFFDARALVGDPDAVNSLKDYAFQKLKEEPYLYVRLLDNISHVKKGIGVLGQLLPSLEGKNHAQLNLKCDTSFGRELKSKTLYDLFSIKGLF